MKKVLGIAAVISVGIIACVKSSDPGLSNPVCTPVAESAEQPQIQAFIAKDSVPFNKDSSGVYYHISAPGTGLMASVYSTLFFTFKATLLDGTIIDSSNTTIQQPIATAIPAIQDMAEYFKIGTKIQLIVPSSLAYSCQGFTSDSITIAPNSVLFYNLNITNIQ